VTERLDGLTTGIFTPRHARVFYAPWLPRFDRVKSIAGLNGGLVDDRFRPLDDNSTWDWIVWDWTEPGAPDSDDFSVGPHVDAGSSVRYIYAWWGAEPPPGQLTGWRLYFTPTQPAALGDLRDVDEVFPIHRLDDGTAVPSIRWGVNYFSRISPADRIRNFPGWYSIRFSNPTIIIETFYSRVIITQPLYTG